MKKLFIFVSACLLLVNIQAQTLYSVESGETVVEEFDIQNIERAEFNKTYVRIYNNDATTKSIFYTNLDYMTFEDPGLITALPSYVYVPYTYRGTGFLSEDGSYYIGRTVESEHFILFWQKEFGDNPSTTATSSMRTNTTTVLNIAEKAWTMYVDSLKFIDPENSKTEKYKMMMFLNYTSDWVANGSGYDDVIGSLNLSPWAASAGATVSHEIGHMFQYQTHCDIGSNKYGFMYGLGSGSGNGYWEQTAQWQAYTLYPSEAFTSSNFGVFTSGSYLSPFHEDNRYANYFINYYWAYKRGADMVGRIWRNAVQPEDPAQAYMRLNGITLQEYNDETYDMAARWATWDIPAFKNYAKNYMGSINTNMTLIDSTGYWRVNSENCIQDHGFNIIKLSLPESDTVKVHFEGIPGTSGYRNIGTTRAGWRYGFVALLNDDTRVYGEMGKEKNGTLSFAVPEGTKRLWFVVSSAPSTYKVHSWDDNANNDEQWPYQVKFEGTDYYQIYSQKYSTSEDGLTTTVTFDINLAYHASAYQAIDVQPDLTKVAEALHTTTSEVTSGIGSVITFYGVNVNGTTSTTPTANGYGYWYNNEGNICSWGSTARIFSECTTSTLTFNVGQYPGVCTLNKVYTVRQKIARKDDDGNTYNVLFVFNVKIVPAE